MGSSHDSGRWTCKKCFATMAWDESDGHRCAGMKQAEKVEAQGKPAVGARPAGLDPKEQDPFVLWAEIHRLQAALKGPQGFPTWQDAALHERLARIEAERQLATLREKIETILKGMI